MNFFFTLSLMLVTFTTFAGLPPEGKYIDFYVKNHSANGNSYAKEYPLKFKYAIACPLIDTKIKDHKVKFPQFDRNLFAMMVPCLKFNYKMTKERVSFEEQEEHIANFKNWLKTCAEENLIDIIDVTNTLDLPESRKLAAAALDKKIRTKLRKNVYYLEDIEYLKLRPLSFAKQFLSNLKKHKNIPALNAQKLQAYAQNFSEGFERPSVSWMAWLKGLLFKKQTNLKLSETKELVRYNVSPFANLKFKKQPDTLFQKIKSWVALVLWN